MLEPSLSLSPSKIGTYESCPRKFRFLYIDRLGPKFRKARPYFTLGNNVHAVLRDFFTLPQQQRQLETLRLLLEEKWTSNHEGFRNKEEEETYKNRAIDQLHQFARKFDLAAKPLLIEKRVSRKMGSLKLQGVVDRLDQDGKTSHVIDYKTGGGQKEMSPFSLYFYALILEGRRVPPVQNLSYIFLANGVMKTWVYDAGEAMRVVGKVTETAYLISADTLYTPRPGWWCRHCDFLEICPQGQSTQRGRANA